MDLLGGYGSDGSSSSSTGEAKTGATSSVLPSPPAAVNGKATSTVVSKPPPSPSTRPVERKTKRLVRGRKLLSLGAVLPPEIFDRLTNPEGYASGGSGASSSSGDEEEGGGGDEGGQSDGVAGRGRRRRRKEKTTRKDGEVFGGPTDGSAAAAAGNASSSAFSSLLEELHSTRAKTIKNGGSGNGRQASNGPEVGGDRGSDNDALRPRDEEKLGFAFTSVSTTETRRRKTTKSDDSSNGDDEDDDVVDVHAAPPSDPVAVPAAGGRRIEAGATHAETGDESQRQGKSVPVATTAPVSTATATGDGVRAGVVRPFGVTLMGGGAGVSAAPRKSAGGGGRIRAAPTPSGDGVVPPPRRPSPPVKPPFPSRDATDRDEEPQERSQMSARRRRKEMERALRSGDVGAVSASATSLHQTVPTYQPAGGVPVAAGAGSVSAEDITVRMYDPRAGSTVETSEVSATHRSKHQIHQLAHSAAALEAARAANRGIGGGRGSSSRADAKRKYGW